MTEERIGGISVGVGGSLAELEAMLAKAEQMVAASAKRVGPVADRYFVPGGAVGGASSTRATAATGASSSARQPEMAAFTRAVGEATTRLTALVTALSSATSSVRSASSTRRSGVAFSAKPGIDADDVRDAARRRVAAVEEAANRRLLRSVGQQLSSKKPWTEYDRRHDYPPLLEPGAQVPLSATIAPHRSASTPLLAAGVAMPGLGPEPTAASKSKALLAPGNRPGLQTREELERNLASIPPVEKYETEQERKDRERKERAKRRARERESKAQARAEGMAADRSERQDTSFDIRVGRGAFGREIERAQVQRAQEQAILAREADVQAAGRTPHTMASSLSSFFFGPRQEQIAAQAGLSAARSQTASAQRYLNVFENEMIANEVKATHASRDEAEALRGKNKAIRESTAYKGAVQDQAEALDNEAKAAERLGRLSSGAGTAVRNLLAVTVGGAAFSVGMGAVGVASSAAMKAASPYFSAMTGWAQKTADLTDALANQARQAQGNAKGVTALVLAQQGFSDATASSIGPIVSQRAQIEAGNKAIVDQVQTLRDAQNLQMQSPNAGLTGFGTGGVMGTGVFGTPPTGMLVGNLLKSVSYAPTTPAADYLNQHIGGPLSFLTGQQPPTSAQARLDATRAFGQSLDYVNSQLVKGGAAAKTFTVQAESMNKALDDANVERLAKLFDQINAPEMGAAVRQNRLAAPGIQTPEDALAALRAINLAGTLVGPQEQLAQQRIAAQNAANSVPAIQAEQARLMPAFIGQQVRSAQYAQGTSLPMQAYLANLASPPTRIGSTVAAAGAKAGGAAEQAKINAGIREAQGLQSTLDGFYAQGQKAVRDTYDPGVLRMFGQAGQQAFDGMLGEIGRVGQQMSSIQSSMNMEQAQYAAAQYTNEIRIASRSLTDIKQLTGQIGAAEGDNLGLYERQNLLLGRQAQQLGFMLSQRQINFQTAVAGFQVPGLTPAEQNARVQEAKTEASYAQKQLDIQRKMFGNQVKIVDIGNLRQATDLVAQLGLLRQGRAVTLDIAIKQESLTRLGKLQSALMAQVQTYTGAVDSLQAKEIANLAEIESAMGSFIGTVGTRAAKAAYDTGRALYLGMTGGMTGDVSRVSSAGTGSSGRKAHASGFLGTTTGATDMTVGEAGTETVAILRNPRSASMVGTGGGGDIVINLTATLDGAVIYRDTIRRMGRDASLRGLRIPN